MDAKELAADTRARMNNDLCDFAARWTVDGDYMRCTTCKRPHIASKADMDFAHQAGCKRAATSEARPWRTLLSILAPLYDALPSAAQAPEKNREAEISQLIDERDSFEHMGTALAEKVSELLNVEVGEWSNANNPIFRAIHAIEDRIAAAPVAPAAAARPTDDQLWDQTLRERDNYHEWADRLANSIAARFGVDIGEHSNVNNPWQEALEAIGDADAPQAAQPDERAAIISGRVVGEMFLRWSEWTTELGEAISRKNIDGFVSELRRALARATVPQAAALTDERIVAALEDAGVRLQYVGDVPTHYTSGSQEVSKIAAAVRALLATPRPTPIYQIGANAGGGIAWWDVDKDRYEREKKAGYMKTGIVYREGK